MKTAILSVIVLHCVSATTTTSGADPTPTDTIFTESATWTEDNAVLMENSNFEVENIFMENSSCINGSVRFFNSSNMSCVDAGPQHAPTFDPKTLARVIVLSIIAVLSLIGNVATLCSIYETKRKNSSNVYLLITHLAIADLLVTLFCIFTEAMWTATVQWYAGDLMCKIIKFLQMFALYSSTFILVVIGFDRMCAVKYPMRRMHGRRQVRRGIICVWVLSAIFSLPQLVIFRVKRGPFLEEFYQCVTYGFYSAPWQEQIYTAISFIVMFLLPLAILITTYIFTFCSIANSGKEGMLTEKSAKTPLEDARHKIIHKAKMKSLMITVVIVLAFIICWTPYYVMMIILVFLDPEDQYSDELMSAIFFFGSATAMINPLIYGAFHLRRSKSKTVKNTSSAMSSRVEHSVTLSTFRKGKPNLNDDQTITRNGSSCNGSMKPLLSDRAAKKASRHTVTEIENSYLRA